jgi:hypothetical protein
MFASSGTNCHAVGMPNMDRIAEQTISLLRSNRSEINKNVGNTAVESVKER